MAKAVNLHPTCMIQLNVTNKETSENKFDVVMMEAIEESLDSFESFDKREVYFHLENAFNISKSEIPRKIEDFADAMEKIFGIGSKLIEIRIVKGIHKRVPEFIFTSRTNAVIFKEYIASLRAFLLYP